MEPEEMEITIDREGRIQVTVSGAHGADCLALTHSLEEAAGTVEERTYLPAYYEQPGTVQEHRRINLR